MADRLKRWTPAAPTVEEITSIGDDSPPRKPPKASETLVATPPMPRLDLDKSAMAFPPVHQQTSMPIRRHTQRIGGGGGRPKFTSDVPASVFNLLWVVVVTVHIVCALKLGFVAALYFYLLGTTLLGYLTLYGISVNAIYLPPIGVIYFAMCGIHAYYVVTILFHTLRSQRSAFTSTQFSGRTVTTPVMRLRRMSLTALSSVEFRTQSVLGRLPSPFVRACYRFWHELVNLYEATAMKNDCYETVYVSRVVIQSLLHLHQIFMASRFLPRPTINLVWVALFTANCWLAGLLPIIFKSNRPRTRLFCVFINLVLDVYGLVVVPGIVFYGYYHQYDHELTNFPPNLWYCDTWLIRVVNELWMLLVISPLALIAKLGIAYNAARGLQIIPTLVRKVVPVPNEVTPVEQNPNKGALDSGSITTKAHGGPRASEHPQSSVEKMVAVSTSGRCSKASVGRLVLLCMGALVLTIHIRAGQAGDTEAGHGDHDDCNLSISPWFATKPACSFLEYRCQNADQVGRAEELAAFINSHEASFVSYLSIRSCPQVEIPPEIASLRNLIGIKIYKSTIARWDEDAALTDSTHSDMRFLFLIDVKMAEFPRGLQSVDFPKRLYDLEICRTNLTVLPDDLNFKWPPFMALVLDEAQFTDFPAVLPKLLPASLSLVNSNIRTVPAELFTSDDIYFVVLDGNPLVSLPRDVKVGLKFYSLSIQSTLITEIPQAFKAVQVSGSNSSYCNDALVSGVTIAANLDCTTPVNATQLTSYPIELEELLNGGPSQK